MKVVRKSQNPEIASVYIAQTHDGHLVEFVQSIEPPIPREKKWVIILSSLVGCPVECRFCEAGGRFKRILSREELLFQIRYILDLYNISERVSCEKFKIQFARIGEPSFNNNVLDLLYDLPALIYAPGLMPCVSTIAPSSGAQFFEDLLAIKKDKYPYRFQLQFSVHSTDEGYRDYLLPAPKWNLEQIAIYGERFFDKGGRKITLNFALSTSSPLCPDIIRRYFDPERFLIKITPVNPTAKAIKNNIESLLKPDSDSKSWSHPIADILRSYGYDTIVSIGEQEENRIGSNCGQYISNYKGSSLLFSDAYTYPVEPVADTDCTA